MAAPDDFFSMDSDLLIRENKEWFKGEYLMYVPGALIITSYGMPILDFKDWDYPYWIYEQLSRQHEDVESGKGFELTYLESTNFLKVESINKDLCLLSFISNDNVVARIDGKKKDIFIAFIEAALQAFYIATEYGAEDCSEDIKKLENCLSIWRSR